MKRPELASSVVSAVFLEVAYAIPPTISKDTISEVTYFIGEF